MSWLKKYVNNTGYLKGKKTNKNPINIIPSNHITTDNMAFPIYANGVLLYPNTGDYMFPTNMVVETPAYKSGGKPKYQPGGNLGDPLIRPPKYGTQQQVQMYTDSLALYNNSRNQYNDLKNKLPYLGTIKPVLNSGNNVLRKAQNLGVTRPTFEDYSINDRFDGRYNEIPPFVRGDWIHPTIAPISQYKAPWDNDESINYLYKRPVQPYLSNNPIPPPTTLPTSTPPPRPHININKLPTKQASLDGEKIEMDLNPLKRPVIKSTNPDKNLYIQFKDPNQSTRTSQEIIHFDDWDTYKEFNDALQNAGRFFSSSSSNQAKTQASSSYGGLTKEEAMEIYKKYTTPKSTYQRGGIFKDPPVNPIPSGVNVFATSNSIYKTPNNTTANKPVEYNPVYKSLAEKNFTKQELNAINNKKPDVLKQDKSAPKPVKLTPFEQKVLELEMEAQTLGQSIATTNQFGEPVIKWDPTQPKASGKIEPEYMDPITMGVLFGTGAYGLGYGLAASLGIAADNALFNLPSLGKGIGKLALKNVPKPTSISSSVENVTLPKITSEQRKDMSGYLKRRQFLKNLQKEGLVGKEFNLGDVNYAARSTDKTNKLTQFALNRQATRFRGVAGSVPKDGKGTEYYSGSTFDMSKPAWNNQISEFENMKNAGVDFDDPLSIAKYQASHVPMQQYNYTSGLPRNENLGGLYASFEPNDYGNYIIRMTSPRDYSVGNYQDWYNKYFDPKNNFDDLSVGLERYTFNPVLSYDKPMAMYRGSANVMGKRGSKMFDVDEAFPFMDKKNLSEEQLLELKNFVKNLSQDYEKGWRGKYQQGGTMSKGGLFKKKNNNSITPNPLYKSNEDYVYNAWRKSLPENLRNESEGYNLRGAWEGGLEPEYNINDMSFHLGSRNPKTGEILKSPGHQSYDMAIESDIKAGYVPMMDLKTGKMYTINNSIDPVLEGPFKNVFAKGGQMIKRADGSYSQRGLWDNIRANKGSGKKPTKAMLEQERKIKNKYQGGGKSTIDSVRHQANKILQYEQLRGGPGGAPLPQYSNPKYMDMLMEKVYPEVRKIMPNASAIEAGEAMDFVFNAGFDQSTNKITKDPRAFALQEYYRQNDPSKLDADGKWAGRKNAPYSFDQEYNNTVGKLPENQRRILMNKGRDWYYKNINNPAPGVPNSNYNDTWFGRIWNTNDYQPFNPNNPNFTPKKEKGGEIKNKYQGGGEKITIPFNSLMPNTAVQSSTLVNNNPAKNWLSNLPELAPEVKNYPIKIKDNRKINTVTNAPINPKTDLKSGDYNYIDIKNIVDASNAVGVDPNLALAIALQESNLGKTDLNYGHVTKDFLQNAKTSELQNYNYDALQLAYAINNKIGKKPLNAYNIQAYNGYGKLGVNTEKGISTSGNKSGVKKWYGVDVTKEPLDLKKNPAYGKTILDLYNNVILPNKEIQDIINYKFDFSESKQSGGWLKKYK